MLKIPKIIYFDQETLDQLKEQKKKESTSACALVRRFVIEGLNKITKQKDKKNVV